MPSSSLRTSGSPGGPIPSVPSITTYLYTHDSPASKEIATAINTNSDNAGRVTASIVTISGSARLVLSANQTGAANTLAQKNAANAKVVFDFFRYAYTGGKSAAMTLDYVPLPDSLVKQIEGYWKTEFKQ